MSGIFAGLLAVAIVVQGQQAYTTAGTYSFVVPVDVTSVSVVCVGKGADGYRLTNAVGHGLSGGGGALSYSNNIAVTPGESLTISIDSSFSTLSRGATALVKAETGKQWYESPSYVGGRAAQGVGDVKYSGGTAGAGEGSGGGAAGYAGDGGAGAVRYGSSGTSGSGGGGGGGGPQSQTGAAPSGGGVGILGQGSSGSVGGIDAGGAGGSSGGNGGGVSSQTSQGPGGSYGGGGGGARARYDYDSNVPQAAAGGPGAVRIIWGPLRTFPSTNTGDV